jgi:hypothetical protein
MAGLCHDRIELTGFWSYDTVQSCKWVPTFRRNMDIPLTYHSDNLNMAVVRSEILTQVLMKFHIFWDMTPCRLVTIYQSARRDIPADLGLHQSTVCREYMNV